VDEPFCVPPAQLAEMTRLQALYIYQHARNDRGRLTYYGPPDSARPPPEAPDRVVFRAHYRALGLPDWLTARLWKAHLAEEKARERAHHGRD